MTEGRGSLPEIAVAVIGCGHWGRNLVRNFHELGALSAVCDSDVRRLEEFGGRYPGARRHSELEEVLDDPRVPALAIATPAVDHHAHVLAALERGKHVFVEKPLATSYGEGRHLVEAADRAGVVLMVGHILEYHPAIRTLDEIVREGGLGRLLYIHSNRLNLGRIRREENILWSFAPHDISVILRLVGERPEAVRTSGATYLQQGVADVTVMNLYFPSGVQAHVFVSWLYPFKEQKLVVIGDRKMAVFDDTLKQDKLRVYDKGVEWENDAPVIRRAEEVAVYFESAEPLRLECQHFLDCIRGNTRPRTDGRSGLAVLEILDAGQRSMKDRGKLVMLPDSPE